MNNLISDKTKLPSTAAEQDLHRQLFEQFHKDSIERYGIDSEQTQTFAQHLSAYNAQSE